MSKKASAIKKRFQQRMRYLIVLCSLCPRSAGGITNHIVRSFLGEAANFLDNATNKDFLSSGRGYVTQIESMIINIHRYIKPLISEDEIVNTYHNIVTSEEEVNEGIEWGVLGGMVDMSCFNFPIDLPYHARIGIGMNAGLYSAEEILLLDDSFYLLVMARELFGHLKSKFENECTSPEAIEDHFRNETVACINHSAACFSRSHVSSVFSFVEAFVNSVGYDYLKRNENDLSSRDAEKLTGTSKRRYLTLESKIEIYPKIIRNMTSSPLVLSDEKQRREPFKSFFEEVKGLRDSSLHYAPGKMKIWLSPHKWLEQAERAARLALGVAKTFWDACYPSRGGPEYLSSLDYDELYGASKARHMKVVEGMWIGGGEGNSVD